MTKTTLSNKTEDLLLASLAGRNSGEARPTAITEPGFGGKFALDGKVMPFPGNTFICHIDPKSSTFAAMSRVQDEMMSSKFAKYFTFLPKSSFHMTVFCGISGSPLGADGWPINMPAGTSLADCTATFLKNLSNFIYEGFSEVTTVSIRAGYSLRLQPATDLDALKLRGARDHLRDATGLHRQDHQTYEFHATLAYPISWIPEDTAKELIAFSNALFEKNRDDLTSIELGPIEFCVFDNMHAFEALALFGKNGTVFLDDNALAKTGASE